MLAIFHKSNRGYATNFLAKLVNGIPDSQFFKKGFKDLFRLHDVRVQTEELDSYDAAAYEEAISRAVRSGQSGFDLAIVETLEESKRLPPAQNPYLRAKAKLMMSGIPVQCILEDRWRATTGPRNHSWTDRAPTLREVGRNSMGLAPAKAWTVRLSLGIGNSIQRRQRLFWR